MIGAGTTDDVHINVVGENGETGRMRLNNRGQNNFETGGKKIFYIEQVNICPIISMTLHKYGADDFMVEKVAVTGPDRKKVRFEYDDQEITAEGVTVAAPEDEALSQTSLQK